MRQRERCWEAAQALREERWREYHAPALAQAEELERAGEQRIAISRLTRLTREAPSQQSRARAANELDDARRARLARLSGQPEPPGRIEVLDELLRRHLLGIVGTPSPSPVFA